MRDRGAVFVAVIDGDLQHDETLLPAMLGRLQRGETDVVIGSRFVDGGGTGAASALIGVLVGAVWNYALSSKFAWGRY